MLEKSSVSGLFSLRVMRTAEGAARQIVLKNASQVRELVRELAAVGVGTIAAKPLGSIPGRLCCCWISFLTGYQQDVCSSHITCSKKPDQPL